MFHPLRRATLTVLPSYRLTVCLICGLASTSPGPARPQSPSPSARIASAMVPLPASLRAGAGVVALDGEAVPHTLRPSANGMVCIADAPGDAYFDVECHHASFIPVIYRMKQLQAHRLTEAVLDQTIEAEIRNGSLKIPAGPTTSYGMWGPVAGYDTSTNTVSQVITAWQRIQVPYATAAAIGVPSAGDGVHPYITASGTYFAHLMLTQPPARPEATNQCFNQSGFLRMPTSSRYLVPGTWYRLPGTGCPNTRATHAANHHSSASEREDARSP